MKKQKPASIIDNQRDKIYTPVSVPGTADFELVSVQESV
jgi:hypothetical protein